MVQQNEILYVTKISRNDVHAKSKWPNPFPWPGFDVFKQLILENLNSFHFDSDTKFQIKMQVCTWGPSGVKDSLLRNSPVGKSADFLGEGVHKGRVIPDNLKNQQRLPSFLHTQMLDQKGRHFRESPTKNQIGQSHSTTAPQVVSPKVRFPPTLLTSRQS
mmetsp:Transcript_4865/g.7569  ORF Transcript_4865/g.7569 Transcript_4865/m.7569 type:complete len:160 (+) Transcript_4865:492-971(+)